LFEKKVVTLSPEVLGNCEMKNKNQFLIPFVGLKIGEHQFAFELNEKFFEDLPHLSLGKGELNVQLSLDKKETMLVASFSLEGEVNMLCSRCNEEVVTEIYDELDLIYKFGLEQEDNEALIVLHPDTYELDAFQPIYEMIVMALPTRPLHEEGECDEEMVKLIQKYTQTESIIIEAQKEEDPRWAALKNLN